MSNGTHLDPVVLGDLSEGLLEPSAAGAANAHLSGCARCQADNQALQKVHDALAGAPDPGPMPEAVAARIDAAIAAAAPAPELAPASVDVTPLDARRPRTSMGTRVLQAAAVIVVLMVGAGVAVSAFLNDGGNDSTNSATAGRAEDSAGGGQAAPEADGLAPPTAFHASGRDYSADSVAAAAASLVAADAQRDKAYASRTLADAPGDLRQLGPGSTLTACASSLAAGGPSKPLAVDLAHFGGEPAAVIVLPTRDDPTSMDVWVVGAGCAGQDEKVLHFARVARP